MALLFFSLAYHMHESLGGWPKAIGRRGFSSALSVHASITIGYFQVMFLAFGFMAPVMAVLCTFFKNARYACKYLLLFVLFSLLCYLAMQLAPKPFLSWFED